MPQLLLVTATGPADPTRASIPFHIGANGAAASERDYALVLAGDATELAKPDVAAGLRGVGVPPLAELLEKVRTQGATVYVWKGCAEARGVSELPTGMAFVAPADVVRLTFEAERALTF